MGCTWTVVQGSTAVNDNFRPIHCHHRNIEKDRQRGEKAASDIKNKAKAMAVALQTIGKFVVKKKVGENDKIFGRCAGFWKRFTCPCHIVQPADIASGVTESKSSSLNLHRHFC